MAQRHPLRFHTPCNPPVPRHVANRVESTCMRVPWLGSARSFATKSGSSSRWCARHLADEYVRKALRDGYRSRAAYKLLQMDARVRPPLLRKDGVAVELGAAPGSWSQVLVAKGMRVIAVDMLPLEPLMGVDFVKGDFTEKAVQQDVVGRLNGELCDLLLSDVSPNRSGNKSLDEARLVALLEQSFSLARMVLRPGGSFVGKVLQGSELQPLLQLSRRFFSSGVLAKPPASRLASAEMYLVARCFDPVAFDAEWKTRR